MKVSARVWGGYLVSLTWSNITAMVAWKEKKSAKDSPNDKETNNKNNRHAYILYTHKKSTFLFGNYKKPLKAARNTKSQKAHRYMDSVCFNLWEQSTNKEYFYYLHLLYTKLEHTEAVFGRLISKWVYSIHCLQFHYLIKKPL